MATPRQIQLRARSVQKVARLFQSLSGSGFRLGNLAVEFNVAL